MASFFQSFYHKFFNQNITCRTSFSDQVSTIFSVFSVPLFPRLFSQNRSLTWMFANHLFRNVVSNDSWWLQNKTYFWVHWKLIWILLFLSTFRHVMKLKMSIKRGNLHVLRRISAENASAQLWRFLDRRARPDERLTDGDTILKRPGFLKMYRVGQNYL